MHYVYILKSLSHKKTYVGQTTNLEKRLNERNSGKSRFTSLHKPWVVIFQEEVDGREEAVKREKYFKSGSGREKIREILKDYMARSSRG